MRLDGGVDRGAHPGRESLARSVWSPCVGDLTPVPLGRLLAMSLSRCGSASIALIGAGPLPKNRAGAPDFLDNSAYEALHAV